MPAGEEKILYPIKYWRLKLGGPEADGLFMQAQLPSLSFSNQRMPHTGANAKLQETTVNVKHDWGPLSLTRGVDKKGSLWKWLQEGIPDEGGGMGKLTKKEITIELCDSNDTPVQTWTFTGAWPMQYNGPNLDTEGGGYAIENISFEFDTCKLVFAG